MTKLYDLLIKLISMLVISSSLAFSACAEVGLKPGILTESTKAVNGKSMDENNTSIMSTDLILELYISSRERSKDTHGRSRSVSIRDSQLTYSSRHTGFNPREDINKTAILDNDQTEKLIAYIMEHNLNRNIKEFKKEAGLGTSISLSTKIQIGDAITEVNVSGAYNDWQKTRQNKPPSNLDNLDYYHDINALLMFMRSRLGISVIEP